MAQGPDGTLIQPPILGDAMMLGPGGVPMVNPAMMQEGAMVFGPDGSGVAADPNFFPLHLFGDPGFIPPEAGMPGFEAFSTLATSVGLDPAEAGVPGFVPPPDTPGMDQPVCRRRRNSTQQAENLLHRNLDFRTEPEVSQYRNLRLGIFLRHPSRFF